MVDDFSLNNGISLVEGDEIGAFASAPHGVITNKYIYQ
tara:strand:+ start:450 stop:563 length:114 start_codon:yes stop_codon:yes gene_type:complete